MTTTTASTASTSYADLSPRTLRMLAAAVAGHHLARRVRTTDGRIVDTCSCGARTSGISGDACGIPSEPIRVHQVDQLGHALEYVRVGPETTETGAPAITVGCVCGWDASYLEDITDAERLHQVHADYPHVLYGPTNPAEWA